MDAEAGAVKEVATPWYKLRPVSEARWFWPGFGRKAEDRAAAGAPS